MCVLGGGGGGGFYALASGKGGFAEGFSTWDQPFHGAKSGMGRAVLAPATAALCSPPGTQSQPQGRLRGWILARLFATPQHPVFLLAEPLPSMAGVSN